MKGGLEKIPGRQSLEKAYAELLHSVPALADEEAIALYSQWARFDPRLAEVLVGFLVKNWRSLNALTLRASSLGQPWPAAMGVLLEFVLRSTEKKMDREDRKLLEHWVGLVTTGIKGGSGEQFFIGLRQFAGVAMWEDALFSADEYRKWGYLARENLLPKQGGASLSVSTRQEILRSLLKTSKRIRIQDYWEAIGRCVSYRQAERDLRDNPSLRACGHTKGRYYVGV